MVKILSLRTDKKHRKKESGVVLEEMISFEERGLLFWV